MIVITDSRCAEYQQLGHPERPQRISRTIERLREQTVLPLVFAEPASADRFRIERAHSQAHLARLDSPFDFDADTPAHPDIRAHAERSVGGALHALRLARQGERALSLLRPPGHHATEDRAMGFCYLNSVAIAALEARETGARRVAVFDFDVHHGNGTEDILLGREGCAFFSVHQFPAYPWTGEESYRNAHNYPVLPGAPRHDYRQALTEALAELERFEPDLVAVSAGFDAYRLDPLGSAALEVEDFYWLGESIRRLEIPAFSVLEGGYSRELPELVLAYLQGWAGH